MHGWQCSVSLSHWRTCKMVHGNWYNLLHLFTYHMLHGSTCDGWFMISLQRYYKILSLVMMMKGKEFVGCIWRALILHFRLHILKRYEHILLTYGIGYESINLQKEEDCIYFGSSPTQWCHSVSPHFQIFCIDHRVWACMHTLEMTSILYISKSKEKLYL